MIMFVFKSLDFYLYLLDQSGEGKYLPLEYYGVKM